MIGDLTTYLMKYIDIKNMEGYTQQNKEMTYFLQNLIKNENIKTAMEIGFNAGHSAEIFLESNQNVKLTSFELGKYSYTKIGKKFIDFKFKNRHQIIIGNSIKSVPFFIKKNKNVKFDFIFIDGGHFYDIAKKDIFNCQFLAHKDTIVILDDTNTNPNLVKSWQIGPNRAWNEAKKKNLIYEIGSINFPPNHGISYGKYILN